MKMISTLASLALLVFVLPVHAGSGLEHYDRRLTQAEVERLMPQYLAEIERTADVQPSPQEREILRALSMNAGHTTIGYIRDGQLVGRRSWTVGEIKGVLAASLHHLEQVSTEARVRDTRAFVESFRTEPANGESYCELGYASAGTSNSSRIVRCIKTRTSGPDGLFDQRVFIMSIDPNSLIPFNVLDMRHLVAG